MKTFAKKYAETKINHIAIMLVLAGAINWGTTSLGYNIVELIVGKINKHFDLNNFNLEKIIYLSVALSAIYLGTNRDFWLPFLGDTVIPENLIPLKKTNKYDTELTVKVNPNTKVAYWAANPHENIPQVMDAYGKYNNSGVVMSNEEGIATLKVVKGSGYNVPSGRYIKPHVHYREIGGDYAMMGPVKTAYYL